MLTRFMRSVRRVNQVLRTEGLGAFIAKAFLHLLHIVYTNDTLLVLEHTLERTDFGDLAPKSVEADLKVICSPDDLAALSAEGYDLSRLDLTRTRRYLSKQGMLFCIFIQRRVANLGWVSLNRDTDFDPVAGRFDYQGCALVGACHTWPDSRNLGLYAYNMSQICKVLKSKGVPKAMATISPDNPPPLKTLPKLGWYQVGKGRLVRFLFWTDWQLDSKPQEDQ